MGTLFEKLRHQANEEGRIFTAALELTYKCNLHCVHCYCVLDGPGRELSTDEYKQLLDDLKQSGCLAVTLTGGEALLRRDFFEIAEYARGQRFSLRLFTNAIRLADEEFVRKVLALGFISIDISLYGASESTYQRVTGKTGFTRVLQGIDYLRAQGQRMFIKIPLMQENYDDLDQMIALCRERELPHNVDPWMTPKDDGSLGPCNHQISDEQLRSFLQRHGGKIQPAERHPEKAICTAGRGAAVIGPTGDVFGCVQGKFPVGNVRERPVGEIWREAEALEKQRALKFSDFEICNQCEFRESCFICPAISNYESGHFTGPNRYSCRISELRYELGQIESRPLQPGGKPTGQSAWRRLSGGVLPEHPAIKLAARQG